MKKPFFTTHYAAAKSKLFLTLFIAAIVFAVSNTASAQITITTESGTNFTGANGVGGNSAITFAIENTNTIPVILTQIDDYWQTANSGTTPSLWYTAH